MKILAVTLLTLLALPVVGQETMQERKAELQVMDTVRIPTAAEREAKELQMVRWQMRPLARLWLAYSAECYANSTGGDSVLVDRCAPETGYYVGNLHRDCTDSVHVSYGSMGTYAVLITHREPRFYYRRTPITHRTPTFDGFMEWMGK